MIKGLEAMAVASLMLFVESLQVNIKAAIKLDEGSRSRLMTLTETVSASFFFLFSFLLSSIFFHHLLFNFVQKTFMTVHCAESTCSELQILDAVINKSLVKSIQDIVDDDGSVKDTAVWLLHPILILFPSSDVMLAFHS